MKTVMSIAVVLLLGAISNFSYSQSVELAKISTETVDFFYPNHWKQDEANANADFFYYEPLNSAEDRFNESFFLINTEIGEDDRLTEEEQLQLLEASVASYGAEIVEKSVLINKHGRKYTVVKCKAGKPEHPIMTMLGLLLQDNLMCSFGGNYEYSKKETYDPIFNELFAGISIKENFQ